MSKKMMLLALAAVSAAMFAMPAVASATFNHLDKTTTFTVHGPAGSLSTVGGSTVKCTTTTGSGVFTTTTTGTLDLTFSGCTTSVIGFPVSCTSTSPAEPTGSIRTTPLTFDLITIDGGGNGIRVKPTAPSTALAHFQCAGVQKTVEGSVIGTLTAPNCGGSSSTATIDFNLAGGKHGQQEHTKWTGGVYDLSSGGETAAMDTHATITFPAARTLICT